MYNHFLFVLITISYLKSGTVLDRTVGKYICYQELNISLVTEVIPCRFVHMLSPMRCIRVYCAERVYVLARVRGPTCVTRPRKRTKAPATLGPRV